MLINTFPQGVRHEYPNGRTDISIGPLQHFVFKALICPTIMMNNKKINDESVEYK